MGFGGTAGRLVQLRQCQRRSQLKASRLLLLRDRDGGEKRFLGGLRVRWVTLEQNLAADAVTVRDEGTGFSLLGLCEHTVEHCKAALR